MSSINSQCFNITKVEFNEKVTFYSSSSIVSSLPSINSSDSDENSVVEITQSSFSDQHSHERTDGESTESAPNCSFTPLHLSDSEMESRRLHHLSQSVGEPCNTETENEPLHCRTESQNEEADCAENLDALNFAHRENWKKISVEQLGGNKILLKGISRHLKVSEAFTLTELNFQRAERFPEKYQQNGIFLLDACKLKPNLLNLEKQDPNGYYEKTLESKSYTFNIITDKNHQHKLQRVATRKLDNLSENQVWLTVSKKVNKFGLVRSIMWFSNKCNVINNSIILQYYIDEQYTHDTVLNFSTIAYPSKSHKITSFPIEGHLNTSLIDYWGPYRIPFTKGSSKRLNTESVLNLAAMTASVEKGRRCPQLCKKNAVFVIDAKFINHPYDVAADGNGKFTENQPKEIRACTVKYFKVDGRFIVESTTRKRKEELSDNEIIMHVNYKCNNFGLHRCYTFFTDEKDQILFNSIVLQYFVDPSKSPEGSLNYTPESHGSSKHDEPYHPRKKSLLEEMKSRLANKEKRPEIYNTLRNNSENMQMSDVGDDPRSYRHIQHTAKNIGLSFGSRTHHEADDMAAYNEELEDNKIIWKHIEDSGDTYVIGEHSMKKFIKVSANQFGLFIDMSYNQGFFYYTPITIKCPHVESYNSHYGSWGPLVMTCAVILHENKEQETYFDGLRCVAKETDLIHDEIGVVTDGEPSIYNACDEVFLNSIRLRCMRHFLQNIDEFIRDNKLNPVKEQLKELITSTNGLFECENDQELDNLFSSEELKNKINTIEKSIDHKGISFITFLTDHKHVFSKMTRAKRRKAKLPVDENNIPARCYTNASECINHVMAAQKRLAGYTKKQDITKLQFILEVYEPTIKKQLRKIESAITGTEPGNYRLSSNAEYCKMSITDWKSITRNQQTEFISAFLKLTTSDMKNKKPLDIPSISQEAEEEMLRSPEDKQLSLDLVAELPMIPYAKFLQRKATLLLNKKVKTDL